MHTIPTCLDVLATKKSYCSYNSNAPIRRSMAPFTPSVEEFGEAKASACSEEQQNLLLSSIDEIPKVAQAGFDGFELILDMMKDASEQKIWQHQSERDQNRIRATFCEFFEDLNLDIPGQYKAAELAMKGAKEVLGRIKGLDRDSWPEEITLLCDSKHWRSRNAKNESWNENTNKYNRPDPLQPLTGADAETKDYFWNMFTMSWVVTYKQVDCS